MDENSNAFIIGEKVYLRKLKREDLTQNYLNWLNDPEVLQFSGRKSFPTGIEQLEKYYENLQSNPDLYLAICLKENDKHVGNISLNTIIWLHRSAELSIVVGDKSVWGKGIATDAIQALTKHGFTVMNLYRIWAESPNPAFNRSVQKLGWTKEGAKRAAFFLNGAYVDFECTSILQPEWMKIFADKVAGASSRPSKAKIAEKTPPKFS